MSTTRENDLTLIQHTEKSDIYTVNSVGRCWVPEGYTLDVQSDGRVVVRHYAETIAIVKGISAAKTKVVQHTPRQFRTRVEHTYSGYNKQGVWEDRYYPQYWEGGKWHNLTNANGTKMWKAKPGEAHIEVLIFLARQARRELSLVA